tara:strand:+ start:365 stop:505 length:141 start_codon:yes stop_codon:yes gene_type:complete
MGILKDLETVATKVKHEGIQKRMRNLIHQAQTEVTKDILSSRKAGK